MKVVFDLSVTSAPGRSVVAAAWDMPWASPISGTTPGLVLDFAAGVYGKGGNVGSLGSVVPLGRGSDATRTDPTGALDLVAANVARIDHDPQTLAPLGLLLEAARTNALTDSGAPAPQTVTVAAVPHVLSFYGAGSVTLSGAYTAAIPGSAAYPARTSITFTPAAGNLVVGFSGDVFAPQLEEGAIASSYVPTGAAPVSRADDIATVSLGPWFSATQGTLVFGGSLDQAAANDRIIEIDSGATSTRLSLLWNTVLGKPQFQVWDGGALQAAIAPPGNSIALGDHFRVAIAYSDNDFAVSLNGSGLATDTSGTVPSGLTTLRLGRSVWGAQGLMIAEGLTYYPARLSNAEVQALSA